MCLVKDIFFRDDERGAAAKMDTIEARQHCQACPVMAQCFEYAVEGWIDDGVWGNSLPIDREKERRRRRRKAV